MKAERKGVPIQVGDVTITPIAQVHLGVVRRARGIYVWGSLEPVAVLVRRGGSEARVGVPCSKKAEGGVRNFLPPSMTLGSTEPEPEPPQL